MARTMEHESRLNPHLDLLARLRAEASQDPRRPGDPSNGAANDPIRTAAPIDTGVIPDYDHFLQEGLKEVPTLLRRLEHEIAIGFGERGKVAQAMLRDLQRRCAALPGGSGHGKGAAQRPELELARSIDMLEDLLENILVATD